MRRAIITLGVAILVLLGGCAFLAAVVDEASTSVGRAESTPVELVAYAAPGDGDWSFTYPCGPGRVGLRYNELGQTGAIRQVSLYGWPAGQTYARNFQAGQVGSPYIYLSGHFAGQWEATWDTGIAVNLYGSSNRQRWVVWNAQGQVVCDITTWMNDHM